MKKKLIGIILIVAGMALIFSAIFIERSNINQEKELRNTFEDSMLNAEDVDQGSTGDGTDQSLAQSIKAPEGEATAIVSIPKIELEVAMIEGIDMEKLNYAVAHFSETVNPGEYGNFAIAGHRNWISGAFFARLDELEPGDKIHIKTKDSFHTYSVTESFIVEPEDIWVLDPTGESIITLQTCTIGGQQRLIVRGKLDD